MRGSFRTRVLILVAAGAVVAFVALRTPNPPAPRAALLPVRSFASPPAPPPAARPDTDVVRETCVTPKTLRLARYQEPSLQVVDSDVVLRLPEPLKSTLAECEPNFRPWGLRDFSAAAQPVDPDTLGQSIRELPSAVVGDFNGDSLADIAVEGRTDSLDLLLVLLSTDTGYDVVVLDRMRLSAFGGRHPGNIDGPAGLSDTYLTLVHPGLMVPPIGSDSVDLHTDAFAVNLSDKASSMCYYRNGHFVWLQVGD